jgi:hypothetical protein
MHKDDPSNVVFLKRKRIGTAMKVVSVAMLTEARQAIQSFGADAAA